MSFAPRLNLSTVSGTTSAIHERLTPTPYADPEKEKAKREKETQDRIRSTQFSPEKPKKPQPPVQGTMPSFSDASEPVKSPTPTGRPPMPSFSANGEGNPFLPGPMSPEARRLDAFLTRPLDGREPVRQARPAAPVSFSHPAEAPESPSAAPGSASAVFSHPAPSAPPAWTPSARVVPSSGGGSATSIPSGQSFVGHPVVPSPQPAQRGNVGLQFSNTESTEAGNGPAPITSPSHPTFSHVAKEAIKILPYFLE